MQNFKLFLRSLKKRKMLSIITIGGYAISMAVLVILTAFIISEKSVNRGFENAKNIYRITRSDDNPLVPATLEGDIKNQIPGIQKMCLYSISSRLYYRDEYQQENVELIATNDDFLDMFSFDFIYQSSNPTLSLKSNIILTKSFSKKQFGDINPIGKNIKFQDKNYIVVGVVTDIPKSASFHFDAMICKDLIPVWSKGYYSENHLLYNAFVLLKPNVNSKVVEQQVSGMINHWGAFKDINLSLEPLNKVYFHALPNDGLNHANSSLIYLLSCIAVVIFFMTVFNYTNLTISNGYERFVEIGIKKTTGAGKKEIIKQFLTEALWTSMISMVIAIFLAFLITPLFSEILNKKIDLTYLLIQPNIIVAGLVLFLITGILSGIYPALSLSNIAPIQMISRRSGKIKIHKRGGIVAIQFIITTVLIISALFINKQISYIKHADLGFDKEMMIKLDLKGQLTYNKWKTLKDELLKNPNIISISATMGNPMKKNGSSGGKIEISGEQKMINVPAFDVDEDFIKTFGLEIIQGRNFQRNDTRNQACIINEHLFRELGWEDITGKKLFGTPVIGVVKDFHHDNLYTPIGNLQLNPNQEVANTMNIKINGDISSILKYIENRYTELEPEIPMTFEFYDDWIQSMYQKEEQQAKAVGLFTILAIIISSLGLIGIVEQNTHKKVKEIGIRKVNGAKVSEILSMLNKDFVKWVVIAFIIATPIAYYAMNKWLENFAYKTTLSWWIFALAGLLALGIALLTVSFQSWKAATRNPVEALRYE